MIIILATSHCISTGQSRSASISSSSDGASVNGAAAAGGFVSRMLLANADTLCAAASPLVELDDVSL